MVRIANDGTHGDTHGDTHGNGQEHQWQVDVWLPGTMEGVPIEGAISLGAPGRPEGVTFYTPGELLRLYDVLARLAPLIRELFPPAA